MRDVLIRAPRRDAIPFLFFFVFCFYVPYRTYKVETFRSIKVERKRQNDSTFRRAPYLGPPTLLSFEWRASLTNDYRSICRSFLKKKIKEIEKEKEELFIKKHGVVTLTLGAMLAKTTPLIKDEGGNEEGYGRR